MIKMPMLSDIQLSNNGGRTQEDRVAITSTFNPSALPSGLIEGTFVQREALAARLVEIFERSALRESKHNVLLVGPRGIGKSHLVSLVYHRLRAKKALDDKLRIAYLKEDEWGINSFLDLLVRTLRVAFEEISLELPDSLNDLSAMSRAQAEDHVWNCLKQMLETRTLLLIVENLDVIFEKIGEEGQRQLRALMQTYPQWAVLATTPALSSAISRQVSPFYGFFEVIHLQPLSFEEAVALLQRLAHWNHDERTASFLESAAGRARVRAVRHLAGGNHRIFVLFYDFLSKSESEELVVPLLKTIDALTPYYQSQMTKLSPLQQKIVNFLCENRKPATVTAIAKNCFTSHQTTANQLKQLLSHRYVRVDRVGRESFYELAEPLLRICVEVKTHCERPLDLLVDFMRYWFSREELEHKLSSTKEFDYGKAYFAAALKEYDAGDAHVHLSPEIASLCAIVTRRDGSIEELRIHAQELAELSRIAEDWSHYARAMVFLGRGGEIISTLKTILTQDPQNIETLRNLAWATYSTGSVGRAMEWLDRAIDLNPTLGILFLDRGHFLNEMGRRQDALEAFGQASRSDTLLQPMAALAKADVLLDMEQFESARETIFPFLKLGKRLPGIFFSYGASLAYEGKTQEALDYFEKTIDVLKNHAGAWGNKGIVLCKLEKYEEALKALDRSLALDPNVKVFRHYRCEALLETKRYEIASESSTPEDLSHCIFHRLLQIASSRPKQGKLQQELSGLKELSDSKAWQQAFRGSLTEFANYATDFGTPEEIEDIQIWNLAIHELFAEQDDFSLLLKLFAVLTRIKAFDDRKALLELPREQRLLLIGEKNEEDFLNRRDDSQPDPAVFR